MAALFVAGLLLTGCGDSESGTGGGGSSGSDGSDPAASKPEKPQPMDLAGCLEEQGFEVERRDSNLVRATDPDSGRFININEFPSLAKARAFDRQLTIPVHVPVGRKVATGGIPADQAQLEQVEVCLRAVVQ